MRGLFKKSRFINWGCVGPALIYLGVAIGIIAGAITLERRAHRATGALAPKLGVMSDDALSDELARCQALGRKAEDDQSCIAAWAENRKRFFGTQPQPDKASRP